MIQPLIESDGRVTPSLGMDTDFKVEEVTTPVSEIVTSGAQWDEAVWDTDEWGGASVIVNDWSSLAAIGQAGAVHMGVTVSVPEANANNDVLLKVNGFNTIHTTGGFF